DDHGYRQLPAQVAEQHGLELRPDRVEVLPVVGGHQLSQEARDVVGVEADQEGDDQGQQDLQEEVQRDQPDRQGVSELSEKELARALVEVVGLPAEVDLEAEQGDALALQVLHLRLGLRQDVRQL